MELADENLERQNGEGRSTNIGFTEKNSVDVNHAEQLKTDDTFNLKLDKHGLPLVPQPTSHKDDPLVCCP
jgi:hypothetical protein